MVVKVYISLTSGLKEVRGTIQTEAEFLIRKNGSFLERMVRATRYSAQLAERAAAVLSDINRRLWKWIDERMREIPENFVKKILFLFSGNGARVTWAYVEYLGHLSECSRLWSGSWVKPIAKKANRVDGALDVTPPRLHTISHKLELHTKCWLCKVGPNRECESSIERLPMSRPASL